MTILDRGEPHFTTLIREHLLNALLAEDPERMRYLVSLAVQNLNRLQQGWVLITADEAEWADQALQMSFEANQERDKLKRRIGKMTRRLRSEVRAAVIARDKSCCRYCGKAITGPEIHIDHWEPDGDGVPSNLVTACKPCNIRKADVRPRQLFRLKGMRLLGKKPETPPSEAEVAAAFAKTLVREREEAAAKEARMALEWQPGQPLRRRIMLPEEIEQEVIQKPQAFFSPKDMAPLLGLTVPDVKKALKSGDLKAHWFTPGTPRVPRAEVLRLVGG